MFEQGGFARVDVVFEDGAGSDKGLVAVTEEFRFPDAIDAGRSGVGGLGKGDLAGGIGYGCVVLKLPEAEAGQAVFAFAGDEEVGEKIDILKHDGIAVGDPFDPVFARGCVDRCGDEAEVAAAIVGADEPLAVAVIDGVFVLVFAGTDESELSSWLVGWKDAALGGGVAAGFEDDEFPVASTACADVEALIVVLLDENIGGVRRLKGVAIKLKLALLLFVFDGVEERAVVGCPGDGAYALDFAGEGFSGFEILDVEGVLAEAGGVDGVGEPAAVVGYVGGADGEEGLAFGELVAVEDDLFGSVGVGLRFVVSHP